MANESDVPAPANATSFVSDEIILYGVRLNDNLPSAGYPDVEKAAFLNVATGSKFSTPSGLEGDLSVRLQAYRGDRVLPPSEVVVAAVYGYAFEGHCYRLDKTRIFLFEYPVGMKKIDVEEVDKSGKKVKKSYNVVDDALAQGCGFDTPAPPPGPVATYPLAGYRMWRLRRDARLLELNTSLDDAQKLILEANLPGKRAPNTYNNDMQLAHRAGRLTGGGH